MDPRPTPPLSTKRLLLRPLELADDAAIQGLFPQWEVVRYLNANVPWPYPADGALSFVRDMALPATARGEEWHWTIRLREAPEQMIGSISLMHETDNNRGFWLAPQWQGQGYMSEACQVVDHYWFEVLEQPLMRVPKAAPNQGSRRISERGGMRLVRSDAGQFVSGSFPLDIWEITREEWRRLAPLTPLR